MIIKVRSEEGPNLFIPIPTGLLCSRLTAGFSAKMMEQNGVHATPEQMVRFSGPPGSISESTPIGSWSRWKPAPGTMYM